MSKTTSFKYTNAYMNVIDVNTHKYLKSMEGYQDWGPRFSLEKKCNPSEAIPPTPIQSLKEKLSVENINKLVLKFIEDMAKEMDEKKTLNESELTLLDFLNMIQKEKNDCLNDINQRGLKRQLGKKKVEKKKDKKTTKKDKKTTKKT